MWRKASNISALVLGLSLALLTGAEADTLSLAGGSFSFAPGSFAGQPGLTMFPSLSGTASFDGLTGTYSCFCIAQGVGGFDATTGSFNSIGGQGSSILTVNLSGGNRLVAFLSLSNILNANTNDPTVIGRYSNSGAASGANMSTGIFAFNGGSFNGGVNNGTLTFPLMGNSPIADLVGTSGTSSGALSFNGPAGLNVPEAPPPEIPLPPAIYLFGSALGVAFWMSRRKRSATPSGLAEA